MKHLTRRHLEAAINALRANGDPHGVVEDFINELSKYKTYTIQGFQAGNPLNHFKREIDFPSCDVFEFVTSYINEVAGSEYSSCMIGNLLQADTGEFDWVELEGKKYIKFDNIKHENILYFLVDG